MVVTSVTRVVAATEYRIDKEHANPRATWEAMGSLAVPSAAQITSLIAASKVVPNALIVKEPSRLMTTFPCAKSRTHL